MKIFITGATGFLGYHIANECLDRGYELLCLRRQASLIPTSFLFAGSDKKVQWVSKDEANWRDTVQNFQPEILIHSAWNGTASAFRNEKEIQFANVRMLSDLINLFPYKQIVCLGSQDEYGYLDRIIDEEYPLQPETEYAKAKIKCCNLLESLSDIRYYEWQWIRIFSVYGEKQAENWFITSMIKKCLNSDTNIPLTLCQQAYAYLYCKDFALAVLSVLGVKGKSGVYNLSSSHPISLQELLFLIKELTNSKSTFCFGAYPYRPHQSMLICGNSQKFINAFGSFEETSLEEGLRKTIYAIKNESF